ncbi:Hypothetical protein GbCGDNIH9_8735 [Granulibacter bethesdensis]|uniref:Uncharacterized protein n=1 Tax=Granulibacter bethesdensis TaxID=364410 RepID=A0AAC9K634_9PROT|nr:Hypothetical protein GbCGDNIH9_8735 [Granulibacter bethesdensis]
MNIGPDHTLKHRRNRNRHGSALLDAKNTEETRFWSFIPCSAASMR